MGIVQVQRVYQTDKNIERLVHFDQFISLQPQSTIVPARPIAKSTMKCVIALLALFAVAAANQLSFRQVQEIKAAEQRGIKEIAISACKAAVSVLGTGCDVFTSISTSAQQSACRTVAKGLDLIFFLPGSYNDYYNGCMSAMGTVQSYCHSNSLGGKPPHEFLCELIYQIIS